MLFVLDCPLNPNDPDELAGVQPFVSVAPPATSVFSRKHERLFEPTCQSFTVAVYTELGVPFFFKQWGGTNKKAAGHLLDGREWNERPNLK